MQNEKKNKCIDYINPTIYDGDVIRHKKIENINNNEKIQISIICTL